MSCSARRTDSNMKSAAARGTNGDKVQLCPKLNTMRQQEFNFRGGGAW
ncbi:MAG TPA: hypothetical protein VHF65_08000 [Nitrososphaera sp.]|nr:hypothetical protein [Nitrososphaera sp.]